MIVKSKKQGDVFIKDDDGKVKYDLMDPEFLRDFADVLTLGANKYGVDNWKLLERSGYGVRRYYDALLRHIEAYRRGEKVDPESGVSHLAHACCNLMFLHWFDRQVEEHVEHVEKQEGEWTKPFTLSRNQEVLPNGVVNNPNNIEYFYADDKEMEELKNSMRETDLIGKGITGFNLARCMAEAATHQGGNTTVNHYDVVDRERKK